MPAFYTEAGIANWRGRLHESGIGDFDHDVAPEAPELISANQCMAYVKPDADLSVRENAAALNDGTAVDAATSFDAAEACDQNVVHHFGCAADVGWAHNSRAPMHFSALSDPDAWTDFSSNGRSLAKSLERIFCQSPKVARMSKTAHVFTDQICVTTRHGLARHWSEQYFGAVLLRLFAIDDPKSQRALMIASLRHGLARFFMKVEQVKQICFGVSVSRIYEGMLNAAAGIIRQSVSEGGTYIVYDFDRDVFRKRPTLGKARGDL